MEDIADSCLSCGQSRLAIHQSDLFSFHFPPSVFFPPAAATCWSALPWALWPLVELTQAVTDHKTVY